MESPKDTRKERQLERQNRELSEEINRLLAKERTPIQFKKPKGPLIERTIRGFFTLVIILVMISILALVYLCKNW